VQIAWFHGGNAIIVPLQHALRSNGDSERNHHAA
jgi:hypothetical protein